MKRLAYYFSAALLLQGCDQQSAHSPRGAQSESVPEVVSTPPSWVSLLGIRLGTPIAELQQRYPSVPCTAAATRCTFPSKWGSIVVEVDSATVSRAALSGEAGDDRHEMFLPNRHSLYSAISQDLGEPQARNEGSEYGGFLATWQGADGSELTLQVRDRVFIAPPHQTLTLDAKGSGEAILVGAREAFDSRLFALLSHANERLSLGGVILGDAIPVGSHNTCTKAARQCSIFKARWVARRFRYR